MSKFDPHPRVRYIGPEKTTPPFVRKKHRGSIVNTMTVAGETKHVVLWDGPRPSQTLVKDEDVIRE